MVSYNYLDVYFPIDWVHPKEALAEKRGSKYTWLKKM